MLKAHQKRYLKSLAHAKKPIVILGANGLTPAVIAEIDNALNHHELIKVRIRSEDSAARIAMLENICKTLAAELVQRIGHTATLFRGNPDQSRVQLP